MRILKLMQVCCMLAVFAGFTGGNVALSAEMVTPPEGSKIQPEMPVLTGTQWQGMMPDTKIAFIWGIGHVVSIEEQVVERNPALKKQGFAAKLAEGLEGVKIDTIVQKIDTYYQKNPGDLDLPVMRVIWAQIVRPKLKLGIADRPFGD